jgi:short-subunit dehydrogenase
VPDTSRDLPNGSAVESPVYVILGATGRVGAALSRLLAARGCRLLLAARDTARLAALSDEVCVPAVSLNAARVEHVDGSASPKLSKCTAVLTAW